MFNSVANYLWGSSSHRGQEYSNRDNLEQHHGNVEHLETQQEEDWVVVNSADKENNGQLAHHGTQPVSHCCHSHTCHPQSSILGGHDSLSQNSSNASDAELLDDAASLAQSISLGDLYHSSTDTNAGSDSILCPLHDCGWTNHDMDRYSDTESLPESVFSACSGRSHATYHPCGSRSEPWVVAPPPCFTGSQVGGLSPIASSPLENLLIEHPSMSVYLSFAHSSLPNRFMDESVTSLKEIGEIQETQEQHVENDQIMNTGSYNETGNALQQRNIQVHAAVHAGPFTATQLLKNARLAQHMQIIKASKVISQCKCERENKVREFQSHAKSNNRRNKRMCPSGFKSSRFSQHM